MLQVLGNLTITANTKEKTVAAFNSFVTIVFENVAAISYSADFSYVS